MSRRLVQRVLVHRHGDRTPITSIGSPELWRSVLPPSRELEALARRFPERSGLSAHFSSGDPPFGQLSQLGLGQLAAVGQSQRRELLQALHPALGELSARRVHVRSSPISRCVQSSQALLGGLLGAEGAEAEVLVDTSLGQLLLPDPHPRHPRQLELEAAVRNAAASAPVQEEAELRERCAAALVGAGSVVSLDVLQKEGAVSWNRLAEVAKCLAVHAPSSSPLSEEDVCAIVHAAASGWWQLMRDRELSSFAIGGFLCVALRSLVEAADEVLALGGGRDEQPLLSCFSCHDSSIIALMSALRLRHGDGATVNQWPPYASTLSLDLLADEDAGQAFVQAKYNGEAMLMDGMHCREGGGGNDALMPKVRLLASAAGAAGVAPPAAAADTHSPRRLRSTTQPTRCSLCCGTRRTCRWPRPAT